MIQTRVKNPESAARGFSRSLTWACFVTAVVWGCGPSGEDVTASFSPGDRLFEWGGPAQLEAYPKTNLPSSLGVVLGESVLFSSAPLPRDRWRDKGLAPAPLRGWDTVPDDLRMWRYPLSFSTPGGRPRPRILHRGVVLENWIADQSPFPGLVAWYDEEARSVSAVSVEKPQGVTVELTRPFSEVFGTWEGLVEPVEKGAPALDLPDELYRRVTFGDESRPALCLPAPGRVVFEVNRLGVEELEFSVGVADLSFERVGESLRESRRRKEGSGQIADGVVLRLIVESDQGSKQVSLPAQPEDGWVTGRIRVPEHFGRAVTLTFEIDPGPAGDRAFDWAAISNVRGVGGEQTPAGRPHVVIVDLDTLRADRLGLYGYTRETSPRLDQWAKEGASWYLDAQSTASWTLPSTASLLTGLDVHQHGTDRPGRGLPSEVVTLAEQLAMAGYDTWGIVDGGYLREDFGLSAGFHRYAVRREEDLHEDLVRQWLGHRVAGKPVFLFLQTYLVHAPYLNDDRFLEEGAHGGSLAGRDVTFRDVLDPIQRGDLVLTPGEEDYVSRLYDAGISKMDASLGNVLDLLAQNLGGEPTLIVVTSDHGEEFFEHGSVEHGQGLYHEVLRVPLVIRFPDRSPTGPQSGAASLIDLVPTVLYTAGLPIPKDLPGQVLGRGNMESRFRLSAHMDGMRAISTSTSTGERKLIVEYDEEFEEQPASVLLFNRTVDPLERTDLSSQDTEGVSTLLDALQRYIEKWPKFAGEGAVKGLSEETVEELKALGYLGEG